MHTATSGIYTLSLHDALPILGLLRADRALGGAGGAAEGIHRGGARPGPVARAHRAAPRSEEHTSELQSRGHLVCRLLLEKKTRPRGTTRLPSSPDSRS